MQKYQCFWMAIIKKQFLRGLKWGELDGGLITNCIIS